MRRLIILAALAVALRASPAIADSTAHYRVSDGTQIVLQVRDNGDSRIDVQDAVYLNSGGVDYLVADAAHGGFVVRLDVFTALMSDAAAATRRGRPPAEPAPPIVAQTGTEVVAGRTGRRFRLALPGHPRDAVEVVICTDADLAPAGRALLRHFGPVIAASMGDSPGLGQALIALLDRGALIRLGNFLRLESLDNGALAPSLFTVPGAPISREELMTRLGRLAPPHQ